MTGYISSQNLVTKVETRADHAVVGDLLVEFEYSGYQNMNGLQVPTRVVQRQAGLVTFDATHRVGHSPTRRPSPSCSRRLPPEAHPRPPLFSRRRRRRPSSASATEYSRSAETTSHWPSTWATTSSSSKADRAMRAGWR